MVKRKIEEIKIENEIDNEIDNLCLGITERNEIINFCFEYGLVNNSLAHADIRSRIEEGLKDPAFVESLINTIIVKTKHLRSLEYDELVQVKRVLLILEKLRLELEYENV